MVRYDFIVYKTAYHLQLKGFVGGADLDCKTVDNIIEKNRGKQVNVLIDSTGGNLITGLSIISALKNHGNVSAHFVGLNTSDCCHHCFSWYISYLYGRRSNVSHASMLHAILRMGLAMTSHPRMFA